MSDILTRALEEQDYLMHHGILGQKWGIRRYQNPDGSLTAEGKARYLDSEGKLNKKGSQNFIDNGDGTYYDTAKYSRKLGVVGGIIDLARLSKRDKELKSKSAANTNKKSVTSHSDEYDTVSNKLKTDGWKIDESGDFGGDIWATQKGSFGSHTIDFTTLMDPGDVGGYINDYSKQMSKAKSTIQQNNKQIMKQCKELIAKDIYDNDENLKSKMSRSDFIKSIKPYSAHVNGGNWSHLTELSFTADGVGGHSLDIEYNLQDLKPGKYVSVNG